MKKTTTLLITILTIISLSNAVYADSIGTIKGKVSLNGRAIEGAEVVIINEDMNTFVKNTNKNGYYSFQNLGYGKYLITVKINGQFYLKYKIVN